MIVNTKYDVKRLFAISRRCYERRIDRAFPDPSYIFYKKHPVVIYGARVMGKSFLSELRKRSIPVRAFCDKDRDLWGSTIEGVKVISPQGLWRLSRRTPILIASLLYQDEIHNILSRKGFKLVYPISFLNYKFSDIFISARYKDAFGSLFSGRNQIKIYKLSKLLEDEESKKVLFYILKHRLTLNMAAVARIRSEYDEYFEPPIIKLGASEVFVDCGAFTGDTLETFYRYARGRFNRVYAFEPDRLSFQKLKNTVEKSRWPRVSMFNKGVYSSSGKFCFSELGTLSSHISFGEKKEDRRQFVRLDSFLKHGKRVTFIKMDIEGVEADALKGARNIICKDKPKLAVCVYHKQADLWNIPLLIKELNPDYRIYLRHYSGSIHETICYAI